MIGKMFLAWVCGAVGSLAGLVAIVTGLDYLADGITLFTQAGDVFVNAAIICVCGYGLAILIGYKSFMGNFR